MYLVDEDIKPTNRPIFHIFKKVEENIKMICGNTEDKMTQEKPLKMKILNARWKYKEWFKGIWVTTEKGLLKFKA